MNDSEHDRRSQANLTSATGEENPAPGQADAEDVSELARHSGLSQTAKAAARQAGEDAIVSRHGVVWVRPSELVNQASARVAGRGIDLHAELARRARSPVMQSVAASRRAISERARRLPPVTAFGRRGHFSSGAARSGIGLG